MHELSIAQSLVDLASHAAVEAKAKKVEALHLRLGALAGVVKDALLFGYEVVTQNTLLEGSRLVIDELPVVIYCPQCNLESTLVGTYRFRCASCGRPTAHIVQGKELELVSLEYAD
ncbi:MAG TPA: hydrogenase maturation nickel metallochaperone HypA [Anaerolineae bacterium]|nr:hydrogenase maturation nickel metallochaperone HypA [Anaerolineae bacterium]HMR64607.1 hydrogenase maturation nickel metallochaperone HypA [Anaerolineae bacterium]